MDRLEEIKKSAKATERKLKKFFKETYEEVREENARNGVGDLQFFSDCSVLETDDRFGGEEKLLKDGLCIWLSTAWVSTNKHYEGVETREGYYPVKAVSYWYTPYHYNLGTKMSCEELYEKCEKEKVLYEGRDIKVSLVRRNVIPLFHSCQYCHKVARPEYVMYLSSIRQDVKDELDKVLSDIFALRKENKEIPQDLKEKRESLRDKLYVWHEIVHDDNINKLFTKARIYINDWY